MPSTHVSLHCHIVFSTKSRFPFIEVDWRPRLHAYLGGVVRTLGGTPLTIGGVADHVHLLVGLKATHSLSIVLREIKVGSSKWIHDEVKLSKFAWQEGYGAFAVSASELESVANYIRDQETHHRKVTFQEEYVAFLKKQNVEYDERYIW